jgi:RNA polymerase sigma factor (sigma-70 family)
MEHYSDDLSDQELVRRCRAGEKRSLEELIAKYRDLIYNVSFKMTANREDAADLTQEILIKMITKLDGFRADSLFKTWLYRICVNHILNYKKAAMKRKTTFSAFGQALDNAPDAELTAADGYGPDHMLLVEETKQTCMSGMLLCLDKRHRLVFILGELFGVNDKQGGQVMDVSPENFRMILSRAKKDLYSFMHDKCGLINKSNPCRCARKTKAFIEAGFVNPDSLRFTSSHRLTIEQAAERKQRDMENLLQDEYRHLYLQHHYLEDPGLVRSLNELLSSEKMKRIFNLK